MWLARVLLEFLTISTVSLILLEASNEVKPGHRCGKSEYLKRTQNGGKCTKCSECPKNHMVIENCRDTQDTVCAAFSISGFNVPSLEVEAGWRHKLKVVRGRKKGGAKDVEPCQKVSEDVVNLAKSSEVFWRKLSFSLIAAVCILVVINVFLVIHCLFCRKTAFKTVYEPNRRSRVFSRDRLNAMEHQRHLSALETLESQLNRGEARILIGADGHQYIDEVLSRDIGPVSATSSSASGLHVAQPFQPPILIPDLTGNRPTTVSWTPNGMIVMDSQKVPKRGSRL